MIPRAIPIAHKTPMIVSALCLLLKLTAPMMMATPTAKSEAPNDGENPKKNANPIPPKAAWAIPPEIKTIRLTTTRLPIMPQEMLTRTPAIRAFLIKSNCRASHISLLLRMGGKYPVRYAVGDQINRTLISHIHHLCGDLSFFMVY